jgi:ligand-binding sensor domain-containing protein
MAYHMMRSYILIFSLLWLSKQGFSQADIPVGSWRTHNSYNSLVAIANGPENIYAGSSNALFTFNPATQEIEVISSLSGLNDTDITAIDYNAATEKLVIAYRNGNIDIISNNQITNFSDLLNAEISGSKEIHQIYNYQQESYLSTDFGVLIIDLEKMLVRETFFELGPQGQKIIVYNAVITSDSLYLATEVGVMRGSLQDNLKDFNQWKYFTNSDGLPSSVTKVLLASTTGLLAAVDNAGVFEYDGNVWQNTNSLAQKVFKHGGQGSDNTTLLTTTDTVYQYASGSALEVVTGIANNPKAAINDNGKIWIADGKNGLVNTAEDKAIYPNGPYSGEINNLYAYENKIIAMPPAYDSNFQPLRNSDGFFKFEEGSWENFNSTGYPKISTIPEFLDITGAAYSAANESLYLSSFGYGILKLSSQTASIIDESNSFLINLSPPDRNVLVSAIAAGKSDLSAINFSTLQPLHVYNFQKDTWKVLTPAAPAANTTQIIDVGNSVSWMKIANSFGGGIKIYDAANSRELYLTTINNALPSNEIYDMALDREGKMWVATKRGVVYFHQAAFIFEIGRIDPVFPIFDGRILFKDEKISALAVDGGNRVWMGTTVGLWLFAKDGQEEVLHFMTGIDPLPSNDILDIAINQINGEVFIATTKGLISYRGTSTSAGKREEIKIFPNPVILAEHNIVTIEGVPENANLKITDASGRLIYQTRANGNTATWQGIASNQSLSSGVYFVFVASDDGSEKQVGKIAIIN